LCELYWRSRVFQFFWARPKKRRYNNATRVEPTPTEPWKDALEIGDVEATFLFSVSAFGCDHNCLLFYCFGGRREVMQLISMIFPTRCDLFWFTGLLGGVFPMWVTKLLALPFQYSPLQIAREVNREIEATHRFCDVAHRRAISKPFQIKDTPGWLVRKSTTKSS
jgi:hypothetical protein